MNSFRVKQDRLFFASSRIDLLIVSLTLLVGNLSLVIASSSHTPAMACPPPQRLRNLLQAEMEGVRPSDKPILLPCCYDGLTARLVARAGFEATFMTGFGVSGANGYPDTQLVSYGEMQSACFSVAEGLSSVALEQGTAPIPCIADGDTGSFGQCHV
jgi:hypothetical protein